MDIWMFGPSPITFGSQMMMHFHTMFIPPNTRFLMRGAIFLAHTTPDLNHTTAYEDALIHLPNPWSPYGDNKMDASTQNGVFVI